MSDQAYANAQVQQKTLSGSSPKRSLLQRTCACGQHTIAGGECEACRSEKSTLHRSQRAFEPPSAPGAVPGSSPAQEHVPSFNSAFDRASRFGHDFSQIPIHPPAAGVIQTKLAINKPGDHYEQEADRLSEQVMRMPEPQLQRACACGGACPKCQTEQPGREHESLQMKPVGSGDLGQTAVPPVVDEVLSARGQPLDTAARVFMESRFGHDFSRVRVHTGENAAVSTKAVGALAYAYGSDVIFGAGQYSPHTYEGRRLLAHELAHVVQQQSFIPQNDALADGDTAAEVEAERATAAVAQVDDVAVIRERRAGAIQLKRDDDVKPTQPTLIKIRPGDTDRIEDAYGAGSLDETQWRNLLDSAEQALAKRQSEAATRAYLTLYADVAKLAQATRVVTSGVINVVTGSRGGCRDARPGLNFSPFSQDGWGSNASTGYVNDQGEFPVKGPSFTPGQPQPQVAIVLSRSVFMPEKERTLAFLRHEMMHAEHYEQALVVAEQWLADPKAKRDKKLAPDVQFDTWLQERRKQGLSALDLVLIKEAANIPGVEAGGPNTELLAYVEKFVTAFHLTQPAPADVNHPVFDYLLGALTTGNEGTPWALADPAVRSEALGRLQEYYCHALDLPHRKAFEGWVGHERAKVRRDRLISGPLIRGKSSPAVFSEPSSEVFSPGSVDDKTLEVLQHKGDVMGARLRMETLQEDFFHGLQSIITSKCKGLTTPMKL